MKGVEHRRLAHSPTKTSHCVDSTRDVSISANFHIPEALFTASSMSVLLPRKESPCATAWLFRSRPGCARAHLHIGRIGHHGDGELIDLTPYASPELVNYLFNFGARCCGLRLFGGVTKGEQKRQETLFRRQQGSTSSWTLCTTLSYPCGV